MIVNGSHDIAYNVLICLLFSSHREVFKAKHRKTRKVVALKKVLMENEKEGVGTRMSGHSGI